MPKMQGYQNSPSGTGIVDYAEKPTKANAINKRPALES